MIGGRQGSLHSCFLAVASIRQRHDILRAEPDVGLVGGVVAGDKAGVQLERFEVERFGRWADADLVLGHFAEVDGVVDGGREGVGGIGRWGAQVQDLGADGERDGLAGRERGLRQ